jgi:IS30 family transposase
MAHHATITATLSMRVFFCDPHHPWQRGTNKNTNRLLRQYLHKNADLGSFTQDHLNCVAAKLNHRPRQCSTRPPQPKRSVPPSHT